MVVSSDFFVIHPRHCEERSDKAIQLSFRAKLDCFATLAMTG
jgi:hypothetical protein